ncbi:DUF2878 domain-containing protein [Pseudomonas sp. 10B1]|uniref:DUF2878 domain-containing protein n=1 Tax=unclassified Pseudomonas TaxID=196821 RepID=UPI002B223044|nr:MULTISPECIES: DUF2878 domain-containing protein [unclassified Pseudomonas]MEA9996259.1 DUF2878 domain-containing protein [Pseudomonas sp. AA4]MEB0086699.1 DUF2878 domain-containing protein [Pseudomonas sp. RTI1]MEB0124749.1 DUF2878 domain-containing protein [Pseudomonas sp. CCC1.2]MEB0154878.1 DUF2878 domain-containing protein [Pseudomonas sp. CCC4.3]MEB0217878.1 DUF2878 domain-containing protein [Pseudomonas sp. AB12(2023)]
MRKRLANALLFQIGWFACVLGGNSLWLLLAGVVLAVHLLWISSWRTEGPMVVSVALIGTLIDSLLLKSGVFSFASEGLLIPLWLMVLWAVLATTLNHCLDWTATPWWRASVLGAIGGPMSYYAGSKMAGVYLPLGLWPSMLLLGIIWAVLFPLLQKLAKIYKQHAWI